MSATIRGKYAVMTNMTNMLLYNEEYIIQIIRTYIHNQ